MREVSMNSMNEKPDPRSLDAARTKREIRKVIEQNGIQRSRRPGIMHSNAQAFHFSFIFFVTKLFYAFKWAFLFFIALN